MTNQEINKRGEIVKTVLRFIIGFIIGVFIGFILLYLT